MGNNYTVTMPVDHYAHESKTLTWNELHSVDFNFDDAFQLELGNGHLISIDQVVRLVPKKRLVAFGTWSGRSIVAKIFFDTHRVKRHIQKELNGIKLLKDNKIPTPPLVFQGICADKRMYVLIFKRIYDAKNLDQLWHERESIEAITPTLQSVVIELATQHVLGLMQRDLHLKNFLLTPKTVYTLDGAEVEVFPQLLGKKVSMNHLALFLSQLGVGVDQLQEALFKHYAKARGWLLKKEDIIELFLAIKKWNHSRWESFEKKIFRESTDFARTHDWRYVGIYNRAHSAPEFQHFLKHPDSVFEHPTAKILKAGRSSTVVRVTLDHHDLVVKRYNMKSGWHYLRRCLRPTRAAKSWRLAQKLSLFNVATAKPVAFLEKKFLGLRSKSYYVTEYVSGEHIGEYLKHHRDQEDKVNSMIEQVVALLKNIAKIEITHGDLKMTNILIDNKDHPVFIDLDGASEHVSLSSLRSAWRKELKRFFANFADQPTIVEKLKSALGG